MSSCSTVGINAADMFLLSALWGYKYCVQSFVPWKTFSIGWIFMWEGYACVVRLVFFLASFLISQLTLVSQLTLTSFASLFTEKKILTEFVTLFPVLPPLTAEPPDLSLCFLNLNIG